MSRYAAAGPSAHGFKQHARPCESPRTAHIKLWACSKRTSIESLSRHLLLGVRTEQRGGMLGQRSPLNHKHPISMKPAYTMFSGSVYEDKAALPTVVDLVVPLRSGTPLSHV